MSEVYFHQALPPGTMVQEYRLGRVLGTGGFGIVYGAENKFFNETVAIKEFLPADLACRKEETRVVPLSSETEDAYRWALKKFLEEARTLRELGRPKPHRNIVRVQQFIEANGTAYMVMDFEEGRPLSQILEERGTLPEEELKSILEPLLDGLEKVHEASVWHRDIKPNNILIRQDGSPVLIDFGAARREMPGAERSVMASFSPDYAALEQEIYAVGTQGPWTDIYALGATLYRAVTGDIPTKASERLQGAAYVPASQVAQGGYTPTFLKAIDAALELKPEDRPQSITKWQLGLLDDDVTRHRPVHPQPPIPVPPPGPRFRLTPRLAAVSASAIIVIAAIVIALWWIGVGPEQTAFLSVTIKPAEAVHAGSKWKIEGAAWQESGSKISLQKAGGYTISFNDIDGWDSPNNERVEVREGKESHIIREYVKIREDYHDDRELLPPGSFQAFYTTLEGHSDALKEGVTLTTEDGYYLSFNLKYPSYLYVAQIDSAGLIDGLFPNDKFSSVNPLQPGIRYRLPEQEDEYFFVDDRTIGKEEIYVIAAPIRIDDLEDITNELKSADDSRKKPLATAFTQVFYLQSHGNTKKLWFWNKSK